MIASLVMLNETFCYDFQTPCYTAKSHNQFMGPIKLLSAFLSLFNRNCNFFSVPWEPSKSLEKQVRGHLYSSLLENLRPYTQYKARIRAANDLGTGDPSNVIVVSTE